MLIELLISALLSVVVIGLIGSVFLSIHSAVSRQNQQLLLSQNIFSAVAQMKEQSARAGFHPLNEQPLILSGAENLIALGTHSQSLGFLYYDQRATEPFFHVVYKFEALSQQRGTIKVCEKSQSEILRFASAATSGFNGYCYSLFDEQQINIRHFRLEREVYTGPKARREVVSVSLDAQLTKNSSVTESLTLTLSPRNSL